MHSLEADLRQRDDGKGFERSLGSSKAMEFPSTGVTGAFCPCIQGLMHSDECLASLSLMFNKTTSLLPEGLFASLGVSRGVEGDLRGVKLVSIFFWLSFYLFLFYYY